LGATAALVVALALVYWPLFLGRIVFFRDPAHWNFPARMFLHDSVARGEAPWWNPDVGLGFAVLGNPLYGPFYPPNWLYALVSRESVVSLLTWQSFGHLVWGSLGVLTLARRFGASPLGGLVAGLAWGLSGYTTAQWSAGLLLLAGAWVPWVAVGFLGLHRAAIDGAKGRRLVGAVARAALPVGMAFLLGEVFVALMGLVFGAGCVLVAVARDAAPAMGGPGGGEARPVPLGRPALVRLGLGLAATVVLGAALAAVVVWPARVLVADTGRAAGLPRDLAEMCSLHPLRFLEFFAAGSMGDPYGHYVGAEIIGEPRFDGAPLSYGMYMGAAVLALAACALGRGRRHGWALAALAAGALVLALGYHTPVHGVWRTVVPPFAYMRYPEKYMVLFVAALGPLAALGVDRLLGPGRLPLRRLAALLGVLASCAASAGALFPAAWAPLVRAGAIKGALAVLGVLAVGALARRGSALGAPVAVVVVLLDLAAAVWPLHGFATRSLANDPPPAARRVLAEAGAGPARPRVYRAEQVENSVRARVSAPSLPEGAWRSLATLIQNASNVHGIAALPGYDAALPVPLQALWIEGRKSGQSVLRLLGIGHAVLPVDPAAPEARVGIEPVMDPLPGARLYRVPGALPRVYLAANADVVPDDRALGRAIEEEVVAGRRVLLAPGAGAAPLDGGTEDPGACRLTVFENTRLEAECEARRPAIAVFVEQHAAGWRAAVDGQPAPLLRANLVMRAVPVPPGRHRLTLTYTPPGLSAGATVTLTGVGLLVLGLVVGARRRR
jgi:hypothetical protein